jgi:hypothetical protein
MQISKKQIIITLIIFLAPISLVLGAIYEILAGKTEPILYFFLVAIPGSLLAACKELKEIIPPEKLLFEILNDEIVISTFEQQLNFSENTRWVTTLAIPVRISNKDPDKPIDILDVNVMSMVEGIQLVIPEMKEISVGSMKKWIYPLYNLAVEEIFNAGNKTIGPMKVEDYTIGLHEYSKGQAEYRIRITFVDNYGRKYSYEPVITNKK